MISFYEKPACLKHKEDADVIDASSVQTPSLGQRVYFIAKRKIYEAYIRAFHFETRDLLSHFTFSFEEICLR